MGGGALHPGNGEVVIKTPLSIVLSCSKSSTGNHEWDFDVFVVCMGGYGNCVLLCVLSSFLDWQKALMSIYPIFP